MPQAEGLPAGQSKLFSPMLEENTDSFFASWVDPQWGHGVPFQSVERTRTSLSF